MPSLRNPRRAMFMSAEGSFFQYQRKVLYEEDFESFAIPSK
ncbi:MAG TPA: hypothetical protein VGH02_14045 [Rhizomicrobium sp.]